MNIVYSIPALHAQTPSYAISFLLEPNSPKLDASITKERLATSKTCLLERRKRNANQAHQRLPPPRPLICLRISTLLVRLRPPSLNTTLLLGAMVYVVGPDSMRARWKALGASRARLRTAAFWAAWLAAWVRGAAIFLSQLLAFVRGMKKRIMRERTKDRNPPAQTPSCGNHRCA
jgi:hypothetical protein